MFCYGECADAHLLSIVALQHFVFIDPFCGIGFGIEEFDCVTPTELGS